MSEQSPQKKTVSVGAVIAGTQGTTGVALVGLWINACLTAGRFVVPSNELMVIVVGWLSVPAIIWYRIYVNRLQKEATEEGVTT